MKYLQLINLHLCVIVPTLLYIAFPGYGFLFGFVWLFIYILFIY